MAMDVGGEAIEKDTTPENTSGEAVEDDETPMKTEEDTVEGEADLKAEVDATEEVATAAIAGDGDLAIGYVDASKSHTPVCLTFYRMQNLLGNLNSSLSFLPSPPLTCPSLQAPVVSLRESPAASVLPALARMSSIPRDR